MEIQLIHNLELKKLDGLDGNVQQSGDLFGPSPSAISCALLVGWSPE